ncbi:MAG TPA: DUF2851 family protein [Puia sp.]|uniref:DUF2851 family protein n=1 Tax=Puia sp. TaxID=2045100 RepID=UPI002C5E0550|nr:DUF2851 family protein [Puia sp.]HVU96205.1 DUF2851 family protein [Puia sp.]
MREELLHFIWRYRHFHQQGLVTEDGRPLGIAFPGEPNTNQGPDFRDAKLSIGGEALTGAVELHIRSSDWLRHAHDGDEHYRSVILHVVWEHDLAEPPGGIPVLVLQDRVAKPLLSRYQHLMRLQGFVPCERQLSAVGTGVWRQWMQTLATRRLQRRALVIFGWLEHLRQDWEETTWWLMARSLGQPVNAAVFEAVARSLPLRLLRRHRLHAPTLEALLLGQAGLLKEGEGAYREYGFWQTKYGLRPVSQPVSFLRMRPGHSPGLRLTQLAALLADGKGWFSIVRDAVSMEEVLQALSGVKGLGAEMRRGMLINAFIPVLFAYGQTEKALRWMEGLRAERNATVRSWQRLGVVAGDAAGSQALLELKNEYCNARRCLECAIGRALLAA